MAGIVNGLQARRRLPLRSYSFAHDRGSKLSSTARCKGSPAYPGLIPTTQVRDRKDPDLLALDTDTVLFEDPGFKCAGGRNPRCTSGSNMMPFPLLHVVGCAGHRFVLLTRRR